MAPDEHEPLMDSVNHTFMFVEDLNNNLPADVYVDLLISSFDGTLTLVINFHPDLNRKSEYKILSVDTNETDESFMSKATELCKHVYLGVGEEEEEEEEMDDETYFMNKADYDYDRRND